MRKKLEIIVTAVFLLVVILPMLLNILCVTVPFHLRGTAKSGAPYRFIKDEPYWAPITGYAVTKEHIYVLYDGKSILQCYNQDGVYLHSYHFEQGKKGRANLAFADGRLFLMDRDKNVYELADGEIIGFYSSESKSQLEQEIGLSYSSFHAGGVGENAEQYAVKFASIYRTEASGEEVCVIRRPMWTALANPLFLWCCTVIPMVIVFCLQRIYRN